MRAPRRPREPERRHHGRSARETVMRLINLVLALLASAGGLRLCAPRCCEQPPAAVVLTGVQRRELRSHAGRLAAAKTLHYVQVADNARSLKEVDSALTKRELVRCKFAVTKKAEAKVMAEELAQLTGAAVAEVLGHTALLYRPGEPPQGLISK